MKLFFVAIFALLSTNSLALEVLEDAYEVEKINFEFSEISNAGSVRAINCTYCVVNLFKFDGQDLQIVNGQTPVSIDYFSKTYFNASSLTLFINRKTSKLVRIKYISK